MNAISSLTSSVNACNPFAEEVVSQSIAAGNKSDLVAGSWFANICSGSRHDPKNVSCSKPEQVVQNTDTVVEVLKDKSPLAVVESQVSAPAEQVTDVTFKEVKTDIVVNELQSLFETYFSNAKHTLEFNTAWKNGTGYLDHMQSGPKAPKLQNTQLAKFTDDFNRRGLVIGTRKGNIVIFERFTEGPFVLVSHIPEDMTEFKTQTASDLSAETLKALVKKFANLSK